jgi:transposase
MWIAYPTRLTHTEDTLRALERRLRGRPPADRGKLLRLLAPRRARSLRQAAGLWGYSARQVQRWWPLYPTEGLEALGTRHPRGGRAEQVSPEAWHALEGAMQAGQSTRRRDAQPLLHEQYRLPYRSLNGVSQLLRRHQAKLKTGRRRHRQGDPVAHGALKQ